MLVASTHLPIHGRGRTTAGTCVSRVVLWQPACYRLCLEFIRWGGCRDRGVQVKSTFGPGYRVSVLSEVNGLSSGWVVAAGNVSPRPSRPLGVLGRIISTPAEARERKGAEARQESAPDAPRGNPKDKLLHNPSGTAGNSRGDTKGSGTA